MGKRSRHSAGLPIPAECRIITYLAYFSPQFELIVLLGNLYLRLTALKQITLNADRW